MRTDKMRFAIQPAILALALAFSPPSASAQQVEVDLELVLAVDSSASMEFSEFDLQAAGIAHAFRDPEIIMAIQRWAPKGVAVSVVQWSGRRDQYVAVDWINVVGPMSAEVLAASVEAMGRPLFGATAIGGMLRFAIDHIERGPFHGARRIIDVSGDGRENTDNQPMSFRDAATAAGVTINGLAILNDDRELDLYYADQVIGGPDAFVMPARDFHDFARAMRQKLLQEIRGAPLG